MSDGATWIFSAVGTLFATKHAAARPVDHPRPETAIMGNHITQRIDLHPGYGPRSAALLPQPTRQLPTPRSPSCGLNGILPTSTRSNWPSASSRRLCAKRPSIPLCRIGRVVTDLSARGCRNFFAMRECSNLTGIRARSDNSSRSAVRLIQN